MFEEIEHGSVLIFLLQDRRGRLSMCVMIVLYITRLIGLEDLEKHYSSMNTSVSTGSSESWVMASEWLQNCSSEHSECFVPQEPSWYPTRLLHIGSNANNPVKVISTANTQPKGGYVTLSHR